MYRFVSFGGVNLCTVGFEKSVLVILVPTPMVDFLVYIVNMNVIAYLAVLNPLLDTAR